MVTWWLISPSRRSSHPTSGTSSLVACSIQVIQARRRRGSGCLAKGSKNRYGGLTQDFIEKLSGLIARNKKGKGAGKSVHYGFKTLDVHGHKATGIWNFRGRKSYTTTVPLMRGGQAAMR